MTSIEEFGYMSSMTSHMQELNDNLIASNVLSYMHLRIKLGEKIPRHHVKHIEEYFSYRVEDVPE